MAIIDVGPADGTLSIRTDVEGSAARMGHRLVIAVREWSARVEFESGEPRSLHLDADLDSLHVESGSGGITPLSPVDKQLIRHNALKALHADVHPRVTFMSTRLVSIDGVVELVGDVVINGHTTSVAMTLRVGLDNGQAVVRGEVPIRQSDVGVRPYSLMLGQLRVSDQVVVGVDVVLPVPTDHAATG